MKRIESIQHHPIQRDAVIGEMILESEERLKSQEKAIEEADGKRKEIISRIRMSCSAFKAVCPEAWKSFEEDIVTMHTLAMMLDRRTPLDMIKQQKEFGVYSDAQQWGLEKAFVQGQLEILDSMLNTFIIKEEDVLKRLEAKRDKKSSSGKVLTFFRNLLQAFKR